MNKILIILAEIVAPLTRWFRNWRHKREYEKFKNDLKETAKTNNRNDAMRLRANWLRKLRDKRANRS